MTEEYVYGQPINTNLQNRSYTKQMYSFPHSTRFQKTESNPVIYYNIPSMLSQRYTTFGYGKKYDIISIKNTPSQMRCNPPIYDTRSITKSSNRIYPKYSFGLSREYFKHCLVDNQLFIPNNESPGPAIYNTCSNIGNFGPKYSFRTKTLYKGKGYKLNVPGPGKYENYSTPSNGRYTLSSVPNVKQTPWSKAKEKRWTKYKIKAPGPGKYDIQGLINGKGSIYNSKYKSGTARSMGKKLKSIFDVEKNKITPGPGDYDSFSEFGYYKTTYGRFDEYKNNKNINVMNKKPKIILKTEGKIKH